MFLFILNGEKEGERIELSSGSVLIGRSPDCTITLQNDKYISGKHAELKLMESGSLYLTDLDSRNGTFLLGEMVKNTVETSLGDIFRCGHTFFKLSGHTREVSAENSESVETRPEAITVIDMVGSSSLAQALGDNLASKVKMALQMHLRQSLKKYMPQYTKSTGDGFMVIHRKIKPAVCMAMDFMKRLKSDKALRGIRVRIGIHYGETTILPDKDRRGLAVDMAFRVESVKINDMHQTVMGVSKDIMPRVDRIFITEVVHQMISSNNEIKARCIGFFDLKGFTGRHKIYEINLEPKS